MPYFMNRGAKLHYEEAGCKDALIFLHGASWDLHEWDRQIEKYKSRYHVIAMDARGHGESTLPKGKVDSDLFWKDVNALMNKLEIKEAVVCGLSLGGHTALQLAAHVPTRVKALILIGTPCTNRYNLYEKICVPVNRFCMNLLPMKLIAWSIAAVLGQSSKEAYTYIQKTVGNLKHSEFIRVWRSATRMESRHLLSRISCPTLILIGDHDAMTGHQQQFLHQSIKNSRLVTIAHANHGTNLDNPEQVEQEIDQFLLSNNL